MATETIPVLTARQYLEIERAAEFRSEYIDGQVRELAYGGLNHALIATEAGACLHFQLRDTPFAAVGGNLRICCQQANVFTYAHVVVFREPGEFLDRELDQEDDTLTDATIIVEVLSKSTTNYDRGEKFRYYRSLPSFAEYLLLASDEIRAEHHVRQPDGTWLFRESKGPEAQIHLAAIGCTLSLAEVYERAEFDPAS